MKKLVPVAIGLLLATALQAQAGVTEILRDTQRTTQANGDITMVMWMPQPFWEEALKGNPALTAEGRAQVLAPLADYALFGVMRARVGATGLTDVQPKAELLKNMKVEVNGKAVQPLPPESIAPGAQMLLSTMKPAMTSSISDTSFHTSTSFSGVSTAMWAPGCPSLMARTAGTLITASPSQFDERMRMRSISDPSKTSRGRDARP